MNGYQQSLSRQCKLRDLFHQEVPHQPAYPQPSQFVEASLPSDDMTDNNRLKKCVFSSSKNRYDVHKLYELMNSPVVLLVF